MPKVSIAVPVSPMGGIEPFLLKNLLNSCSKQSFQDYEIIISDHTASAMFYKMINKKNRKIKYFWNPNNLSNPQQNINNALLLSKGDFIKILFLDDMFHKKNSLQQIISQMIQTGKKWHVSGCYNYDMTNQESKNIIQKKEIVFFWVKILSDLLLLSH